MIKIFYKSQSRPIDIIAVFPDIQSLDNRPFPWSQDNGWPLREILWGPEWNRSSRTINFSRAQKPLGFRTEAIGVRRTTTLPLYPPWTASSLSVSRFKEVPRTITPYTCYLPSQIGLRFDEVEFSRRHTYVITFPVQNLNHPDIFRRTPLRLNPSNPHRTPPPLSASFGTYIRPPLAQLTLCSNHCMRAESSSQLQAEGGTSHWTPLMVVLQLPRTPRTLQAPLPRKEDD